MRQFECSDVTFVDMCYILAFFAFIAAFMYFIHDVLI